MRQPFHWRKPLLLIMYLLETTVWSYKSFFFSEVINWWSCVDYCDVFISCLDSHSDGTHSLQSIHCWASDAMLHFSRSDEETNSSTSWVAWDTFQQIYIFLMNYFFNRLFDWLKCECTTEKYPTSHPAWKQPLTRQTRLPPQCCSEKRPADGGRRTIWCPLWIYLDRNNILKFIAAV